MQHDVRNVAPLDKVNDVIVSRDNCAWSPYFRPPHPILIEGREWDSIFDFIHAQAGTLKDGLLFYMCQNIHLQRVFDRDVRFYFEDFETKERKELCDAFTFLTQQLRPYDDAEIESFLTFENETVKMLHGPDAIALFRKLQPFMGKDRAIVLTRMHVNHLVYKVTYDDDPMLDLLRSLVESK